MYKYLKNNFHLKKQPLRTSRSYVSHEKHNETVRHFALRVQQLVKRGWCNENAATINLKNNEIFTKGLAKKVKDFAHKKSKTHINVT